MPAGGGVGRGSGRGIRARGRRGGAPQLAPQLAAGRILQLLFARQRGLTLSRNAWTRSSWHSIDESDAESSAGRARVVIGSCGDEELMAIGMMAPAVVVLWS